MNPDSDPAPSPASDPAADSGPSAPRGTREVLDDLSRTLTEAIQKGGRDARRKFDETMPRAKREFAKGVHDLAYGVAYAATFGSALLREFTPESLRDGLREGAASGRRAADEVMRQRREKAEREAREGAPAEGAWA